MELSKVIRVCEIAIAALLSVYLVGLAGKNDDAMTHITDQYLELGYGDQEKFQKWAKNRLGKSVSVYRTPIESIFEIRADDETFYVTKDLRFKIYGEIIDNEKSVSVSGVSTAIRRFEKELRGLHNKPDTSRFSKSQMIMSGKSGMDRTHKDKEVTGKTVGRSASKEKLITPNKAILSKQEKIDEVLNSSVDHEVLKKNALVEMNERMDVKENESEQVTNQGKSDFGPDKVMEEYKERIHRIRERLNLNNNRSVSADLTDPAEPKSDMDRQTINLSAMQDGDAFIQYKDVTLQKIGFDKSGNKLSLEDSKKQISKMHDDIVDKASAWTIEYPAENEKGSIIVFTDPTCPFCARLHSSIPEINKSGITVRYLMYPRMLAYGEKDSRAISVIENLEKAWCSPSPSVSMDALFKGKELPDADCGILKDQGRSHFPVKEHFFLGSLFSISGTPFTFTSDGKTVRGFRDVDDYLNKVGL